MDDIFNSWLVETPIAHRGLHDKQHPENSLSAFERAIDEGYPIELDVQLIADGTVVVFHDESLSRLTNNDGYIKFLNKSDLDMLELKDSKEKIPTFEETLKFVDGRVPLLIEIKKGIVKKGEEEIVLTKNEMIIFLYLYERKGTIVNRDELMTELWNNDEYINDNALTVNISRLRSKLRELGVEDAIETRKGQGYILL